MREGEPSWNVRRLFEAAVARAFARLQDGQDSANFSIQLDGAFVLAPMEDAGEVRSRLRGLAHDLKR